jgi:hypothetical protein
VCMRARVCSLCVCACVYVCMCECVCVCVCVCVCMLMTLNKYKVEFGCVIRAMCWRAKGRRIKPYLIAVAVSRPSSPLREVAVRERPLCFTVS